MTRSKIVFLGTMISQIITFATSFVITYFYTPEDLGLLGTLTALISIIAGTLCFRLEVAVIQASEENAADVFLKSTFLGGIACTIFCVLCFFLPWEFAHKISYYFIPFVLWCWGYCFFFNSKQVPFKFNELRYVSWGAIWRSAFTLVFQFLGGILNPSFMSLLSGRISGDYVGGVAHSWNYLKKFNFQKFKSKWSDFLRSHSEFIFYMAPHHLCLALSNNIIIFFLEESYGLVIVGFYALAQRLIQAPLELIGSTMSNVTIQRYGELTKDPSGLKIFYVKVVVLSFGVAAFLGFAIWYSVGYFIPLLGAKWANATSMVENLVPFFMSTIFAAPTTYLLRFINRARLQLILELIELILKVLMLGLVTWRSSDQMVLAYGIATFAMTSVKTTIVYKLITKN